MIWNGFIQLLHAEYGPFWVFAACFRAPLDKITKISILKLFMHKNGTTIARYGLCGAILAPNCCLRAVPIVVSVPTATPYWLPSAAYHEIKIDIFRKLGFYSKKAELESLESTILVGWGTHYMLQLGCWNFFMYRQQHWLLTHAQTPFSTQE